MPMPNRSSRYPVFFRSKTTPSSRSTTPVMWFQQQCNLIYLRAYGGSTALIKRHSLSTRPIPMMPMGKVLLRTSSTPEFHLTKSSVIVSKAVAATTTPGGIGCPGSHTTPIPMTATATARTLPARSLELPPELQNGPTSFRFAYSDALAAPPNRSSSKQSTG